MNWPRNPWISRFGLALLFAPVLGCGVKGDPLPPEKPVEIGRGRPTYRRATKKIELDHAGEVDDEPRR